MVVLNIETWKNVDGRRAWSKMKREFGKFEKGGNVGK